MVTKIKKWGNSLGLRIPKSFADEVGVEEGSIVEISLEGNRLIIRPVRNQKYNLSALLSGIRKDNLHKEIATGKPAGREDW
ncbi:MAG: AbrB/MazE/SpoVT family DNA-binding domain-containing protein [Candidatus Aminicenantes bacterium]